MTIEYLALRQHTCSQPLSFGEQSVLSGLTRLHDSEFSLFNKTTFAAYFHTARYRWDNHVKFSIHFPHCPIFFYPITREFCWFERF